MSAAGYVHAARKAPRFERLTSLRIDAAEPSGQRHRAGGRVRGAGRRQIEPHIVAGHVGEAAERHLPDGGLMGGDNLDLGQVHQPGNIGKILTVIGNGQLDRLAGAGIEDSAEAASRPSAATPIRGWIISVRAAGMISPMPGDGSA